MRQKSETEYLLVADEVGCLYIIIELKQKLVGM